MSKFFSIIPVYTAGKYIVISITGMAFFILWERSRKRMSQKEKLPQGAKGNAIAKQK